MSHLRSLYSVPPRRASHDITKERKSQLRMRWVLFPAEGTIPFQQLRGESMRFEWDGVVQHAHECSLSRALGRRASPLRSLYLSLSSLSFLSWVTTCTMWCDRGHEDPSLESHLRSCRVIMCALWACLCSLFSRSSNPPDPRWSHYYVLNLFLRPVCGMSHGCMTFILSFELFVGQMRPEVGFRERKHDLHFLSLCRRDSEMGSLARQMSCLSLIPSFLRDLSTWERVKSRGSHHSLPPIAIELFISPKTWKKKKLEEFGKWKWGTKSEVYLDFMDVKSLDKSVK